MMMMIMHHIVCTMCAVHLIIGMSRHCAYVCASVCVANIPRPYTECNRFQASLAM